MLKLSKLSCLTIAVLLSGCANSELFGGNTREVAISERDAAAAGIVLGATDFKPVEISSVSNTGTFVGQKVITFRNELRQLQKSIKKNNDQLQKLRKSVVSNALQYHRTVGIMEAKLQVGTTPGNPRMLEFLNSAQNNIQTMSSNLSSLNQFSASVSADVANTDYLSEAIQSAYSISGAIDEDHAHLRTLENEANQTSVLMHSLEAEIGGDITRQQQYIDTANDNLANLNEAIKTGSFGVNNSVMYPRTSAGNIKRTSLARPMNNRVAKVADGRPLLSVNFANKNINYKDGLKQAVGNAVAKKNNAMFDVVAVNPVKGQSAQSYASDVFQEIISLGVSADRVNISSRTDASISDPAVLVFVR